MSRNITNTATHMNIEEKALRNTESGKIIFTRYQERMCALYLQNNRLLSAQILSDIPNRIGAIYIGKVKNVTQNINACFLEITDGENCFLSLKDAASPVILNRKYDGRILEGDEILVQICREVQKGKLASVTADISLADERVAISLGNPHVGYSGKLKSAEKDHIKDCLTSAGYISGGYFVQPMQKSVFTSDTFSSGCAVYESAGMVVRTGAKDCDCETLIHSIEEQFASLFNVIETAKHRTCFTCVKQAPEDFKAVLNQLAYPSEYTEILTDDATFYDKLSGYCAEHFPDKQLRLYEDATLSLSSLYSLEQKIETALHTRVWLKSGAYLVIEPTEALTVIDVNTGKYEAKKASWETYERINREAAEEIALQLRLRNLSGIILIDFINMETSKRGDALVTYLRRLVNRDRVKTHVVDITPLGLVEITRKKINKPLSEQFADAKITN